MKPRHTQEEPKIADEYRDTYNNLSQKRITSPYASIYSKILKLLDPYIKEYQTNYERYYSYKEAEYDYKPYEKKLRLYEAKVEICQMLLLKIISGAQIPSRKELEKDYTAEAFEQSIVRIWSYGLAQALEELTKVRKDDEAHKKDEVSKKNPGNHSSEEKHYTSKSAFLTFEEHSRKVRITNVGPQTNTGMPKLSRSENRNL